MGKKGAFSLSSVGGLISAAGSIYTGITSFTASKEVAADLRFEGNVLSREAERTSNIILLEGRKFAAGQSIQYLGSGVQLAGSALITIAQTVKFSEAEAGAVTARGIATEKLMRRKAGRIEAEGRAALVGGILEGAGSLISS